MRASPGQTAAVPPVTVIVPGEGGRFLEMVSERAALVPQELVAVTDRLPLRVKEELKVMVILFVPWPELITPPVGGTPWCPGTAERNGECGRVVSLTGEHH